MHFFQRFKYPIFLVKHIRSGCGFTYIVLAFLLCMTVPALAGKYPVYNEKGLRWPTDASRRLTSSFAEERPDRFHAGIDFSTNGGVGYPIYAIDDGYLTRLKANFTGYGRVLYFRFAEDKIAVYGHLSKFRDSIENRLREEQKRQGTYEVELFFSKTEFSFKKGDLIGYTGDTGAGAPHLHFELRNGMNRVYNPALEGFVVPDERAPVIRRLAMRPLDGNSEVNGEMGIVVRRVRKGAAGKIRLFGRVGVSADIRDFQTGGWHSLSIRSIELYVDDKLYFRSNYERFKYQNNRMARLDFDYPLFRRGYRRFKRLYVEKKNSLSFYDSAPAERGWIDTRKLAAGKHKLKVVAFDEAGNRSQAVWPIVVQKWATVPPVAEQRVTRLATDELACDSTARLELQFDGTIAEFRLYDVPEGATKADVYADAFGSSHRLVQRKDGVWIGRGKIPVDFRGTCGFSAVMTTPDGKQKTVRREYHLAGFRVGENARWAFPENGLEIRVHRGDLWSDMVMALTKHPAEEMTEAPVYRIDPFDYPYHRPFEITFQSPDEPWNEKAVLVYRETRRNRGWKFLSNEREMNGFILRGEALSNEEFSVMLDTIPPAMTLHTPKEGRKVKSRRPRFEARVSDELSGLEMSECDLQLDGESVIWIYDPDRDVIEYTPWANLARGKHTWTLKVVDKAGNSTVSDVHFRIR